MKTWHSLPTALHKTEEFFLKYWFISFVGGFQVKSAWNLDFMNPADFRWNPHEIWQISPETHQISWNLPDFRWNPHAICQFSWNLLDFRWNLPDFMWNPHEICRISWNPPDVMNVSFWWSPSIGLSFERPNSLLRLVQTLWTLIIIPLLGAQT